VGAGIDLGMALAPTGIAAVTQDHHNRVQAPSNNSLASPGIKQMGAGRLYTVSDVALQYATTNGKVLVWAMNMVTGKAEPDMTIDVKAWVDFDEGREVLLHSFLVFCFLFAPFTLCRCTTPCCISLNHPTECKVVQPTTLERPLPYGAVCCRGSVHSDRLQNTLQSVVHTMTSVTTDAGGFAVVPVVGLDLSAIESQSDYAHFEYGHYDYVSSAPSVRATIVGATSRGDFSLALTDVLLDGSLTGADVEESQGTMMADRSVVAPGLPPIPDF
jgi:hypothetical protein